MRRVEDNAPGAPELAGRQSSGRPLLCGEESCGIEPDRAAPMRGGEQRNENDLPVAWIAQVDSLGGAGSTGVLPTMDAMLAELGAKGRRKLQGPGKRVSTSATLSRKSVSFLHFIRCEFNECAGEEIGTVSFLSNFCAPSGHRSRANGRIHADIQSFQDPNPAISSELQLELILHATRHSVAG
jgi:hypothetical protein